MQNLKSNHIQPQNYQQLPVNFTTSDNYKTVSVLLRSLLFQVAVMWLKCPKMISEEIGGEIMKYTPG